MSTAATTNFNGHSHPENAPTKGKKVFLRSEVVSWPADEIARRQKELQRATVIDDMQFSQRRMLDGKGNFQHEEPHDG